MFDTFTTAVHDADDRPLLDEAIKSANAGAFRAAYVMTWLSCAESLKRRFKIAALRDGAANAIIGEIATKEAAEKSIDSFLLTKGKDYGFLTGADYLRLKHVYEKRCIFGHPYETAPLETEVMDAMSVATSCLLSRPVQMRHGYLDAQAVQIVNEKTFLDDFQPTVAEYAKEIVARGAPELLGWWLAKIWKTAAPNIGDPSTPWLSRRVAWISDEVLSAMDEASIKTSFERSLADEPKIAAPCLARTRAFSHLSPLMADQVFSYLLENGGNKSSYISALLHQKRSGSLTDRQLERLDKFVEDGDLELLSQSGLRLIDYIQTAISDLKSHDWNIQNPIAKLLINVPDDQFDELDEPTQIDLGRNILQSAEAARSCASFIDQAAEGLKLLPANVVLGMVSEMFTNERGQMRPKIKNLTGVVKALGRLSEPDQSWVVSVATDDLAKAVSKDALFAPFEGVSQKLSESFTATQLLQQNQQKLLSAAQDAEVRSAKEHDEIIDTMRDD